MRTQRGWFLFFFGILLSTFLGGAIRVLLSPAFVRQWVDELVAKSQPRFTIEFEEARMSFGRGWVPQVAIELVGLYVRAKDPCITGSEIEVSQMVVPLNLRALFAGKVRFGAIDAEYVTYRHRPKRCEGKPTLRVPEPAPFDVATEIAPLENFFEKRWNKEVVNTTRFLDELNLLELRFVHDEEIEPVFYLRDLHLDFFPEQHEVELRFNFWPGVTIVGDQPFGPTGTALRITSDSLRWSASGNLKEGQFQSKGHWAVDDGKYEISVSWKDVPLTNFMALMSRWDFSGLQNFRINNQWFACGFTSDGEVRKALTNPLRFTACEFYGDTGRAKFAPFDVRPDRLRQTRYVLEAKNLDVRRFSAAIGYERWSPYLPRLGHFTGEIRSNMRDEMEAKGTIKGVEVYLGEFGLPTARETIENATILATIKDSKFKIELSEIAGERIPKNLKVSTRRTPDEMVFSMMAPMIEYAKDWPLVAAVDPHLSLNNEALTLQRFQFELSQKATLDWKVSAQHQEVQLKGQGTVFDGTKLRGLVEMKKGAKRATLTVTGTLREPVVTNDQSF